MVGMFSSMGSGGIKSVQPFSITITGANTSNTATITAVNILKSYVAFGGYQADAETARLTASVALSNSTTVTATRNITSGGTIVTGTVVESY